jgi:hypothetical protein
LFDRPRLVLASRVAVLVFATVSSYFALHTLSVIWAPSGDFGFDIDLPTAIVDSIDPQDVSKDIREGDRVDLAAMSFADRDYLYSETSLPLGLRLTVPATRAGARHTVTFESVEIKRPIDYTVWVFTRKIVAMASILVAIVLVWVRPNPMLWGLAAFLIRQHGWYYDHTDSPEIAALEILSWATIYALGPAGLIVFAARFPDNRTSRATKYWDLIAIALFLYGLYAEVYQYVPLFTARPIGELPDWATQDVSVAAYVAVFVALCLKLIAARSRSSLRRFRWIVVGYGVGVLLGSQAVGWVDESSPFGSSWPDVGQQVMWFALPVSVFHAVIRHRAFGLGYLANRTLVYGAFAIVAAATVVIGVFTASAQLTSTVGVGCAMFVALLVGMRLQASRTVVVRLVDRVFLRRRYEASVALDRIRDALRGSNDARRITDEIASTLELTSLAVFSRVADGGFVRKAAVGWPPGSAWHLLPQESLTQFLDDGATIAPIPDDSDDEPVLPAADARPRFALALRRGERVERAVLVGSLRNGTMLDRDAMRSLRDIFDETVFA